MSCQLRRCLLVAALAVSALSAGALAGEVTRVPFTAVREDSRTRAPAEAPPAPSVRLVPFAGIGFPDMDEVEDYVDYINDNFDGTVDDVDRYWTGGLGLEREFSERWSAGLAYHWMEAETDGTTWFMGVPRHFELEMTVDGAELYARHSWPETLGPLDLEALAGIGWYTSDYREQEDGWRLSGHDDDVGVRLGLGARGELAENLELFVQGSYLWLEFDDYHKGSRDVTFVMPGDPRAEADFSGFQATLGLAYRF
ncbi:MAG: outer membrane beta-barrel protein [Candidatus Brocadiia bacterium]